MLEGILKDVIKTKLKMMNAVIDLLPAQMKEHAVKLEKSVLTAVYETSKDYIENNKENETEGHLNKVTID